jgi:hypothetical protein
LGAKKGGWCGIFEVVGMGEGDLRGGHADVVVIFRGLIFVNTHGLHHVIRNIYTRFLKPPLYDNV